MTDARREVIDVDENGCNWKDLGFSDRYPVWTQEAEATGYFERVPAIYRYPDGRLEEVVEIRLTPEGHDYLKRLSLH